VGLGQAAAAGQAQAGTLGWYFVIRSVSPPDGGRLDADIFGIGSGAAVDHIRNVRVIVQGYLQAAHGYSEADAELLAFFITIYNAVSRGDWEFISERYKDPVLAHLSPANAGISVRWDEWAGQTRMLIPLANMGGLSAIDTGEIADLRVIEELRREEGMGLDERMDLVNLLEREAEQAEERAAQAQAEADALAQEAARIEEELAQIAAGGGAPGQTPEQAAAEEARLAAELAALEAAQAAAQAEADAQRELAEQRFDDAQEHRDLIAEDQQQLIAQPAALPPAGLPPAQGAAQGLLSVVIERPDSAMGRLVSFDPATRVQRASQLATVHARTMTFVDGRLLAVAGERVGIGAVRLVEIDAQSLEMIAQGDDDIHPGTLIWLNGAYLYAIVADYENGGALHLGRFDLSLALQARSQIALHPHASLAAQQGVLLTQRADGSVALLDPTTLMED
jgi:hypothetical protein